MKTATLQNAAVPDQAAAEHVLLPADWLQAHLHDPGVRVVEVDVSRLAGVDLDGPGELITYCTIGGRAATAWFVLTYLLGRDHVRVYDGSWAEWGRLPDSPVERS